jgi:hypothetical protein
MRLAAGVVGPDRGSAGRISRTKEVGKVSSSARWVVCGILAVLGVLALVVAVIYLTVPIHSIPSFIPGKHPVNGHYHKRGAVAAVIGIVLLAIAAVIGLRDRRGVAAPVGSVPDSAAVPGPDAAATLEESRDAGDAV